MCGYGSEGRHTKLRFDLRAIKHQENPICQQVLAKDNLESDKLIIVNFKLSVGERLSHPTASSAMGKRALGTELFNYRPHEILEKGQRVSVSVKECCSDRHRYGTSRRALGCHNRSRWHGAPDTVFLFHFCVAHATINDQRA